MSLNPADTHTQSERKSCLKTEYRRDIGCENVRKLTDNLN